MPSSRGFLDRFRTSGTPGAAGGAGVPADRLAERDVELAGVFSQIADTEAAAREMRLDARHRAQALRESAAHESRRLLATARREAESDRRDAAARVAEQSEHETAQTLAAAADEAAAIRQHAATALPGYAGRVVEMVLERLATDLSAAQAPGRAGRASAGQPGGRAVTQRGDPAGESAGDPAGERSGEQADDDPSRVHS